MRGKQTTKEGETVIERELGTTTHREEAAEIERDENET